MNLIVMENTTHRHAQLDQMNLNLRGIAAFSVNMYDIT